MVVMMMRMDPSFLDIEGLSITFFIRGNQSHWHDHLRT